MAYRLTGAASERGLKGSRHAANPASRQARVRSKKSWRSFPAIARAEMARCGGNGRRIDGFSPDQFLTRQKPHHAVFNANKDDLTILPEFKYSTE
jgi:hypothetical protein